MIYRVYHYYQTYYIFHYTFVYVSIIQFYQNIVYYISDIQSVGVFFTLNPLPFVEFICFRVIICRFHSLFLVHLKLQKLHSNVPVFFSCFIVAIILYYSNKKTPKYYVKNHKIKILLTILEAYFCFLKHNGVNTKFHFF